jgi:hypothetical protein
MGDYRRQVHTPIWQIPGYCEDSLTGPESDPSCLEKLDDGETESLAFLINAHEPLMICWADKTFCRILGDLRGKACP